MAEDSYSTLARCRPAVCPPVSLSTFLEYLLVAAGERDRLKTTRQAQRVASVYHIDPVRGASGPFVPNE